MRHYHVVIHTGDYGGQTLPETGMGRADLALVLAAVAA